MLSAPGIYIPSTHRSYGPGQLVALRHDVAADADALLLEEIGSAGDLALDRFGQLGNGYRYTGHAFRQVCLQLGAGLAQVVIDWAGTRRQTDSLRQEYSLEAAIAIFNRAVQLRAGTRLAGTHRLLRNTRARLIEGLLGPRGTLVENTAALTQAEASAASRPGMHFVAGYLTGRRMVVRYAALAPLFQAAGSTFHDGLHFTNSEPGGLSAFAAAPLIWIGPQAAALGPYAGGRITHAGRAMFARLVRAYADAAARAVPVRRLEEGAWRLSRQKLRVGRGDERQRRAAIRALVVRLGSHGVPVGVARQVVLRAAYPTAAATGWVPTALRQRTAYDLFAALTRFGGEPYGAAQAAAAQAAYALLSGRLQLGPEESNDGEG